MENYSSSLHYSSSTAVFTDGDKTSVFVPGTRVRFNQTASDVTTTKYFEVASSSYSSVTDKTTITFKPNSQYTLANSDIAAPAYSYAFVVPNQTQAHIPAVKVAKVALASGNANAISFAWQNPEASKILVHRVLLDRTTAGGTATSVMDVGVVGDATSTADTLIDGLDINATGIADNISDGGTNGKARAKMDEKGGTNDYITGKILTANAASLVGYVYIHYSAV